MSSEFLYRQKLIPTDERLNFPIFRAQEVLGIQIRFAFIWLMQLLLFWVVFWLDHGELYIVDSIQSE